MLYFGMSVLKVDIIIISICLEYYRKQFIRKIMLMV
jgi:hypothetical protein